MITAFFIGFAKLYALEAGCILWWWYAVGRREDEPLPRAEVRR